jgi:DUF4097 and DUF4098 domain-containing protein YvlB
MKRSGFLLLMAAAAAFSQTTERKSFSGVRNVVVDNIDGNVEVEGVATSEVEMEAVRKERGSSVRNAEVRLEARQEGERLVLLVDGPFRRPDGSVNWRGWNSNEIAVRYDFKLRVPRDTRVELKTVNGGHVRVSGLSAPFVARNVNGGIELLRMSACGEARTVNGKVTVDFAEKPREDCSFRSVNGRITVTGPADFGGEIQAKTVNGEVLTDYETSVLPVASAGEKRGMRWVYRSSGARVRLGGGGPAMKMETVNGDVVVRRSK